MRSALSFLVLVTATGVCAAGWLGGAAARSDQDRLQGLWTVYSVMPGEKASAMSPDGTPLQVSGNKAKWLDQGQNAKGVEGEISFVIDPRKNPKTIDINWTEGKKKGTYKGIYTIKDDEVRIALSLKLKPLGDGAEERPTSFDADKPPKDCWVLVLILKRAKAEKAAPKTDIEAWVPPSIAFNGFGAVALSPDGKYLAAGGAPGTVVRLWDTATGKETAVLRGHESEVGLAGFSRDGKRLYTASTKEVRVWEVATGKQLQRIDPGRGWQYHQLTLSGDEKWFLSDAENEARIDPDGRMVESSVRLWDVATGKEVRRFDIEETWGRLLGQYIDYFTRGKGSDAIIGAALSRDGKWVVVGTEHGESHLWNAATGKKVRTFERASDMGARPLGFGGDDKWLVVSSFSDGHRQDGAPVVRVWDVATGKEQHAVKGFPFEPGLTDDGKWFVTGHDETTVKVWDVETGKEVGAFAGHKKAVRDCWVSNDKKRLVTFDRSGSARLWDVATGKEVRVIEAFAGPDRGWPIENFNVRVSGDAKLLVGWAPSRLTLWDLESGKSIRTMRR